MLYVNIADYMDVYYHNLMHIISMLSDLVILDYVTLVEES